VDRFASVKMKFEKNVRNVSRLSRKQTQRRMDDLQEIMKIFHRKLLRKRIDKGKEKSDGATN